MAPRTKPSPALSKAKEKLLGDFTKAFGQGVLECYAERKQYEVIPTGSADFDLALGVGGLLVGRLHEWWGPGSVGKTTMALITASQAQKMWPDRIVVWIDMERTFDWPWAIANGVDPERMWLIKPSSAEDAADAVKKMTEAGGVVSLVVLDSIGAMLSEKEMGKGAGEAVVGTTPKIVTRMVNMAAVECGDNDTTLLLINQVRANIGYGADTTTGGGWALKHVTTTKAKFSRTSTAPFAVGSGDNKIQVGHEVAVKIERNKVAPPNRKALFSLVGIGGTKYGPIGVDRADEAARLGLKHGLIQASGSWYTVPVTGERLQGRDAVVEALRSAPEVIAHIRTEVLAGVADQIHFEESDGFEPEPQSGPPVFVRGDDGD